MVPLSFHGVTPDQVCMRKPVFGSVDIDRLYGHGLHFLPISSTFVCFDSTYQPIAWLSGGAANPIVSGLDDDSVSYPLRSARRCLTASACSWSGSSSTVRIWLASGSCPTSTAQRTLSQIVNITSATIKTAVIGFTQADHLQRREDVRVPIAVAVAVADALYSQLGVFAPGNKLQLLKVILPDSVVQTNLRAAMSLQTNVVATLQQQVAAIEAETSRQVAAITAQQTLATQQAYIDANRTLAFAHPTAAVGRTRHHHRSHRLPLAQLASAFAPPGHTFAFKRSRVLRNRLRPGLCMHRHAYESGATTTLLVEWSKP
jgi:hypothetical protein